MPLRVLLTGKLHGPDMGTSVLLLHKAGISEVVAPEVGFVTLENRFKMLREVEWESLNKDEPLLETAAPAANWYLTVLADTHKFWIIFFLVSSHFHFQTLVWLFLNSDADKGLPYVRISTPGWCFTGSKDQLMWSREISWCECKLTWTEIMEVSSWAMLLWPASHYKTNGP